jgi:hypothetical protein
VTKTWTRDTNFYNPNNWDLARVPCANDRVIIPSQTASAIQLKDGSTTIKQLVLPANGEIMLPLTGSLLVTGDSRAKDKCPGEGNNLLEGTSLQHNLKAIALLPRRWHCP